MQTNYDIVSQVIQHRRTVKPDNMNGAIIPTAHMEQIVAMADFAPTHGRTEPLRLNIYSGAALVDFCNNHAAMYWEHTPEDKRMQVRHDKFKEMAEHASHLIVAVMKRTIDSKIPEKEEYASCCASVQNMLLTADSLNVAAIWNTGGMAYSPHMKTYLGLATEDQVVGFIYMGYTDEEHKEAVRKIPLSEKNNWF